MSWSFSPAIVSKSSSVSLPHFSFTFPLNSFHCPFIVVQFMTVPFRLNRNTPPKACEIATNRNALDATAMPQVGQDRVASFLLVKTECQSAAHDPRWRQGCHARTDLARGAQE